MRRYEPIYLTKYVCDNDLIENPGFPQECVRDCDKVGRKNGAMECPNGGTHNGTYNAVILEKG